MSMQNLEVDLDIEKIDDLSLIGELRQEWWPSTDGCEYALVATYKGFPLASFLVYSCSFHSNDCFLSKMAGVGQVYVVEGMRNQGFCRNFLSIAMDYLKSLEWSGVLLYAKKRTMFVSLGFNPIQKIEEDKFLMVKMFDDCISLRPLHTIIEDSDWKNVNKSGWAIIPSSIF